MALFDRKFGELRKTMGRFLAAGLFNTFLAILLGFAGLIGVYCVARISAAGDWTFGRTFDQWYISMGAVPLNGEGCAAAGNCVFSAIDPDTCLLCDLFSRLLDMMSSLALKVFVLVSGMVWTLTFMAFALWFLRYVYDNVLVEQSDDVGKMLGDVVKKVIVISMIGVAIGIADASLLKKSASMIFE
ncbi:MAG: hypothetical protein LBI17_02120, partial [Rickettsiales bacterium]|nr:hypothetical protein [Rickettsiales bacterium]